jgi:DNA polymerase III subunit delta
MPEKYPNAKQFKRELDGDRLEQRYLFLGEEDGEKEKCINRICVMAFNDPGERAGGTGRFHIENEDEFLNAVDFALSPPLFSSRRVCVMYNIDGLSPSKQGGLFQDLAGELPDSTLLIMTTREKKPPAFMSKALERFKIVQFWRYFDNDIYNYIAAGIRKLGLTIDDRAMELLVTRTGNDIKKIDDAIDMLRFSGETGAVSVDIIKNFIDDLKEATVYEFVDALFKREPRALVLFKKVSEEGAPGLKIMYQILRQAEMIETYYSLVDTGVQSEDAMTRAGVYSKNREKFWRYAESFPRERLRRVFPLISAADYKLKSGGVSKELAANPVFNLAADMLYSI